MGETLGIHAMRRILLCLLHHMDREKRGLEYIVQVEAFAALLESYLALHEREDEGVRTLDFASTSHISLLRKTTKK